MLQLQTTDGKVLSTFEHGTYKDIVAAAVRHLPYSVLPYGEYRVCITRSYTAPQMVRPVTITMGMFTIHWQTHDESFYAMPCGECDTIVYERAEVYYGKYLYTRCEHCQE